MSEDKKPDEKELEFHKAQRKLAWITMTIAALLFLFAGTYYLSQDADAQTNPAFFEIIEDPNKCERIRVFGERAWVPFRLLIQHPPTDTTLSFISGDDKESESHEVVSDQNGFDFITEEINTWTVAYQITYPASNSEVARDIVIEFASEGKTHHKETKKMFGTELCLVYEITTDLAPEFPEVDDLLTDVGINSLREMQHLVPAVNTLDQTLGRNTFVIVLYMISVTVLIGYMYFKAKEFGETRLQTQRQILDATKNSNKQTELAKKAVDHIYTDLIPSIDSKMNAMMDKFELEKNSILLDIKTSLGVNKLKPEERKGAVENVYNEKISQKLDDDIPEILKDDVEEEKENKEEITFEKLEDIEGIQDKNKSTTFKDKITEPLKKVLNKPIDLSSKLPERFKKSQPIFMKLKRGKVQIDFALDQEVKPIKLKKLYKQNENKINETLYRKYWKLTQQYPNVPELRKRSNILKDVLTEYAKSFEQRRQAEAEVLSNKNGDEKKNGV